MRKKGKYGEVRENETKEVVGDRGRKQNWQTIVVET